MDQKVATVTLTVNEQVARLDARTDEVEERLNKVNERVTGFGQSFEIKNYSFSMQIIVKKTGCICMPWISECKMAGLLVAVRSSERQVALGHEWRRSKMRSV